MPEIALNAHTSLQQLQDFARTAGNRELHVKTQDGVTTLFCDSKLKAFFNPTARSDKEPSVRATLDKFVQRSFTNQDAEQFLGAMRGGLTGTAMSRATDQLADKYAFKMMLQNPEQRAAFERHCDGEFNSEGIQFLNKTEAFAKRAALAESPEELTALKYEAQAMIDQFIKPTGDKQVNLPAALQKQLLEADIADMGRVDLANLFGKAEKGIQKLLEEDVFKRFKLSDAYQEMVPARQPAPAPAAPAGPSVSELGRAMAAGVQKQAGVEAAVANFRTMEGAMANPTMLKAFSKYCAQRFVPENLAFLQAVQQFEGAAAAAAADPSSVEKLSTAAHQAQNIVDRFFNANGPEEINLPADLRLDRADIDVGNMSADELGHLFDKSKSNIHDLMEHDVFPGFTQSDQFKNAVAEIRLQAANH